MISSIERTTNLTGLNLTGLNLTSMDLTGTERAMKRVARHSVSRFTDDREVDKVGGPGPLAAGWSVTRPPLQGPHGALGPTLTAPRASALATET
ncbi:MAG: hypothetical protein ABJD68_19410, partial [Nakamurella sp.]